MSSSLRHAARRWRALEPATSTTHPLTGVLAVPAAWAATVGRGLLAGIATTISWERLQLDR